MSAIITQNFRLDTTERFVDSLSIVDSNNDLVNAFYMGLGRPNPWDLDTQTLTEVPHLPGENDSTTNQVWQELFAMKKIAPSDLIFAAPRNKWIDGDTYVAYDDKHANIEQWPFMVISNTFNVYLCLKADGPSTRDPDVYVGIQTVGVTQTDDGYTWKYMYTVPTSIANKFLTTEFVPVQMLNADPGTGAAQALKDQWSVQASAVPGAIYNIAIDAAGDNYTQGTTTVIIDGNGTGATADAVITNNKLTGVHMTSYGSGYDYVSVTIVDAGNNPGTEASARAVLSPKGGYGSDPRYDLRAHYVAVNTVFDGSELDSIPTSNDFRQLSIIKNPKTNVSGGIVNASAVAINTAKALELNGSGFIKDNIITALGSGNSGATGFVVEFKENVLKDDGVTYTDVLYYIQNESTGFTPFADTDTVTVYQEPGDTSPPVQANVDQVNDALIKFNSGEIMFVENRDAVTRSESQMETIRLVIEF